MADIEGSKPRKFITKTKLTNPSLYSLSITSLLDPENSSLSKIYQALEKKQQHTIMRESRLNNLASQKSVKEPRVKQGLTRQSSNIEAPTFKQADSLQLAEKEFQQNKLKKEPKEAVNNGQQRKGALAREASYESMISRGSSLPSLLSFNYRTSREIKQKQSSQYNIISNL